jgi:hypothetical protein
LVADNAAAEGKKRIVIPPMAIVAGIVVVLGLAGFWYLDRVSRQPAPGPAPPTAAARAYAKNLRFVGADGVTPEAPAMESHESYLKQSIVEISGNILNSGDRALNSVEVDWIFYEPGAVMPDGQLYQEKIWHERTFLVTRKTGGLDPGKARPFRVAFDNVPETWNQAMPQVVIAGTEFK